MKTILAEGRFSFISEESKAFITTFDEEINKLGYSFGGNIGDGFCWGRYMIIYYKNGVKGKHVAARIYIRDNSIVLRLFLNDINKHHDYIVNTKSFIKEAFTGEYGSCRHCHNDKGGACKFRKTYTLENRVIDKCNGYTFEFGSPDLEKLPEYIDLLKEFYATKRPAKKE